MAARRLLLHAVSLGCLLPACGDLYMNNPRGSNNKLTEQANNAQNQNRLFDSQNNAAGGYQVGDNCVPNCKTGNNYDHGKNGSQEGVMYYYHGSELLIEFTVQHGCGTPGTNTACQLVVQYMCDSDVHANKSLPGLRDGKDLNGQRRRSGGGNNANPQGANKAAADDYTRGRHEPFEHYDACRKRQRNKGLYTADQNLNKNIGATATRQNSGGTRRGLECPEERDYYPYWHPSGWRDAAVLTSNAEHCEFYRQESQNVKPKGHCIMTYEEEPPATFQEEDQVPNNQKDCESKGGSWAFEPAWDIDPPECLGLPESRDNHHGNIGTGHMASYLWKIPDTIPDDDTCVLRLRYNMSTSDFKAPEEDTDWDPFFDLDSAFNTNPPLKTDPKDDFVGLGWQSSGPLQMQVNTAQFGRTFQDRSHAFKVKKRPDDIASDVRIVNYNVRGRRGNIVQVYPAVEYDFVPQDLHVNIGDLLHFQWTGSDANQNNNAGNGKAGTDRSNLVQISGRSANKPVSFEEHSLFFDAKSQDWDSEEGRAARRLIERFAFLDQQMYTEQVGESCPKDKADLEDRNLNDNDDEHCQQLNAAPAYFDGGLVEMRVRGTHHIASTRNNDYSNRSQKATIYVGHAHLRWWEIAAIIGGAVAAVWLAYLIGNAVHAYMNPLSSAFSKRNRPILLRAPCMWWLVQRKMQQREAHKKDLQAKWESQCKGAIQPGAAVVGKGTPAGDKASRQQASLAKEQAEVTLPPSWGEDLNGKIVVQSQRCTLPGRLWHRCLAGLSGDDSGEGDKRATLAYVLINILVAAFGFTLNYNGGLNRWYAVAKTGGYILDFNLSVLLLPTMRSLQKYVIQVRELDGLFNSDPIGFHMWVAGWVAFGTLVHVLGHVMHMGAITFGPLFQVVVTPAQAISGKSVFLLFFDPYTRAAPLTGCIILVMMVAMALTAHTRVRRKTFNFSRPPQNLQDLISWMLLSLAFLLLAPILLPWWFLKWLCGCQRAESSSATDRKKMGGFLIFWGVHKLWAPVYILLLVHGPQCWIWFLWPLILLICDRLVSSDRRKQQIMLKGAEMLKSNVMKLTFGMPPGFIYQAGQYIQICCDQVNGEEWHPFTLTSAPEEKDLSVHIRCGDDLDWCSALKRKLVFEPVNTLTKSAQKPGEGCRVLYSPYIHAQIPQADAADGRQGEQRLYSQPAVLELVGTGGKITNTFRRPNELAKAAAPSASPRKSKRPSEQKSVEEAESLKATVSMMSLEDVIRPALPLDAIRLRLDGPHGAPSELVWKNKVVMLVGAGIGVTPFASILRSLQMQVQAQQLDKSSKRQGRASHPPPGTENDVTTWQACQKVYFYWLCRGQDEFYWFYDLLSEALKGPARDRIEVNLFQTAMVELSQVKMLGDGFKQFMGRPDWRKIMPKLSEKHSGENIGVFLCGPQALRGELQRASGDVAKSDKDGTGARFTVHAENF